MYIEGIENISDVIVYSFILFYLFFIAYSLMEEGLQRADIMRHYSRKNHDINLDQWQNQSEFICNKYEIQDITFPRLLEISTPIIQNSYYSQGSGIAIDIVNINSLDCGLFSHRYKNRKSIIRRINSLQSGPFCAGNRIENGLTDLQTL